MNTTKLISIVCVCTFLMILFFIIGILVGDCVERIKIKERLNNGQCKRCKHFKRCLGDKYKPNENCKCEYFNKERD